MNRRILCAALLGNTVMALWNSGCGKKRTAAAPPTTKPPAASPVRVPANETGLASWYGHPYHGRRAANGEIYDMEQLTAAHRTLPFGTWVRVTSAANGKSVEVRIIDRGPFIDGRVIDLSHAAAREIDMIGPGVAQVRIELISVPPSAVAAPSWYGVQVGAFSNRDNAERLRSSLQTEFGVARIFFREEDRALWRVVVGREPSTEAAASLAARLRDRVGSAFVIRLDADTGPAPRDVTK